MKIIFAIIFHISYIITLEANEKLPNIFIQQLLPIQETKKALKTFEMNTTLQNDYNDFTQKYNEVILIGVQAEQSSDPIAIKNYLTALRELQKTHDQIIVTIKSLIYSSLENGECKKICNLKYLNTNILFSSQNMQNQVITLYRSRCINTKIDWIEAMIQNIKQAKYNTSDHQSASIEKAKYYKNTIPILLFINSNPVYTQEYDKKIIALFEKYRFKYIIYDVFTSKYAFELLKQYSPPNTMYYPTIVIGKRSIHGYGPNEIFDALRQEWFADNPMDILKTN